MDVKCVEEEFTVKNKTMEKVFLKLICELLVFVSLESKGLASS